MSATTVALLGLGALLLSVPLTVLLGAVPTLMGCLTHYGNGPAPPYFGSGFVELGAWWRTGIVVGVVHMAIWLVAAPGWWTVVGVW